MTVKNYSVELILTGIVFIILGLNYFGFCFKEARFLSDKEKIEIVVKHALYTQTVTDHNLGELTPYHDMSEFFSVNPECCEVSTFYRSIGGEGNEASCLGRLTGYRSSIVSVKYLERFRDKNGLVKTRTAEVYPGVSNCGELIWD